MASVFLSYDREDAARARSIALAMEKAGHSVWWDRHIKGGAQYSKEIEAALKAANAVVVLWSEQSVDSAWVRDEAAAGRDSGRLVPVKLDTTDPPLGFRQYQAIDLSRWKGRGRQTELQTLFDAIDGLVVDDGTVDQDKSAKSIAGQKPHNRRLSVIVGISALALIALIGIFWLKPWSSGASVPTVEIVAAEPSNSTRALARDLLVKLGNLQSTRPDALQLVEGGTRKKTPTFVFQIGSSNEGGQPTTSLVLLDGQDRSLLWSKDFQQPSNDQAELKQQVAFTAARVLECAREGLGGDNRRLSLKTLKLYLNACSQLAEFAGSDSRPVIPVLLQVIRDAPGFKPALAKLLLAEGEAAGLVFNEGVVDVRAINTLRKHIDAARKLDPAMAEATLAEISLLPPDAFAQAIDMVDRAKQRSPDNPAVLITRGELVGKVGRTRESVIDAKRATDLDPLSPVVRNQYISTLAYAGRLDSAREELQRAEQLWPGTKSLLDAQFRFHLRYGDPKEALRIVKSEGGSAGGMELFLKARIDPTPDNVDRLIAYLKKRAPSAPAGGLGFVIQAHGEFDRSDELFRYVLNWPRPTDLGLVTDVLFRPALKDFRHDRRFMEVARRAGLLDYWRKSGEWPDFCIDPDLPYDCKVEAAKVGTRKGGV